MHHGVPLQAKQLKPWLLALTCLLAIVLPMPGQSADSQQPRLEVFVRADCPHCVEAKRYLPTLAARHPGLEIVLRPVDADPAARDDLVAHSIRARSWPPSVPTFAFEGRLLVGFESAERTGPALQALIGRIGERADRVQTRWFGELSVDRLGLPAFTLALGLLDGFNPCAMWVLLFLLSLLVHLRDRRRMALIAGTFVLASGAVYFAFMAAWLNLFLAVGLSTPLRIGLALLALAIAAFNLKDFIAPGQGPSFSIPEGAKPGLYARMRGIVNARSALPALAATLVLALVVNLIELLCTAGIPALYTAVLAQQGLDPAGYYAYLGLYIGGYITDDALMVGLAVAALGQRRMGEREGRILKLLSAVVMGLLGAILLWRPELLF